MSGYIAGDAAWRYPAAGDPAPERSDAKVLLLTRGGICTTGNWDGNPFFTAWSPLPKRDKEKEALLEGPHPRTHQQAA